MEIHLNEEFGKSINQTILKYELRQNLEIGSWDGTGSTKCFVDAMKQLEGELFLACMEILPERIEILKTTYKDLNFVHPINNSSISYSELVYKNFDHLWNSIYNKIPKKLYDYQLVKFWYDRDVELLKSIKQGSISNLNKRWDSVLIDGGEFFGYSEYLLLKDNTKVFFLDDVHNAFKCYQVFCELKSSDDWELLFDLPNARNGAAAFIKKSN
jgi:hypothetical protein